MTQLLYWKVDEVMRAKAIRIAVVLLVAFGLSSPVLAQKKPDFSGVWMLDLKRSDPAPPEVGGGPGGRGLVPERVNIKQTRADITINQVTYKFDGSEVAARGGRGGEARAKAAWNGAKLVISTTIEYQGRNLLTTQDRTLEARGKEMIVVNKVDLPQGHFERRLVYKKS